MVNFFTIAIFQFKQVPIILNKLSIVQNSYTAILTPKGNTRYNNYKSVGADITIKRR